jgi:N-acetylmuramoyl-L-alanine amidase
MPPRRLVAIAVVSAVLVVAGVAVAIANRGDAPERRATVSSTTEPARPKLVIVTSTATTLKATTTTAVTTTTLTSTTALTTTTAVPPTTAGSPTAGAVSTGSLGSLRGRTIAIDPGHDGGNYAHTSDISRPIFIGTQTRACDTTGTETNDGYTESAYTLDVSLRLRDVLVAAGANVVMTRTTNDGWGPCIDERAAIGNRAHADAAISIHADGGPAGGRGFHVLMPGLVPGYTDDIYAASHSLGVDVRDAFLATGMPTSTYYATQGLAERTDLGGLNLSNVPKVFIETGNMRNATDAALLKSADFRQRAAEDLAVGLNRFLAG